MRQHVPACVFGPARPVRASRFLGLFFGRPHGFLLLGLMAWIVCAGCTSQAGQEGKPAAQVKRAVPVSVATVERKVMEDKLLAVGNVEPCSTVAVKSLVDGEITAVHFREGQDVRKGEPLFTIDPRPFQAALGEARAILERDRALAAKAEEDMRRYESLMRQEVVSRDQYDQVRASLGSLRATIKADEAAVETVKLKLGYCSIASPVTGRTGSLMADRGNTVKAGEDKPLVVIQQIEPIYVGFSIPETRLPEVMELYRKGRPEVTASAAGATPEKGMLSFIDNGVDTKTGTIRLKATFENRSRRLWPGQFVNVALSLGTVENGAVVPAKAVQTGQAGQYVYVITPDKTAEVRKVRAGLSRGVDTVIAEGLDTGETVVVDGQLLLTAGTAVEVKQEGSSTPGITPAKAAAPTAGATTGSKDGAKP